MSIAVVFGLIAIASGFVPHIKAFDIRVSNPPIENESISPELQEMLGLDPAIDYESELKAQPYFEVDEDVRFELYTVDNPTEGHILELNNYSSVANSNFNKRLPTRFIIHGWLSDETFVTDFTDAYFNKGKHRVNVIAVNWRKGSGTYNYWSARQRVRPVSTHVAKFIDFMHEGGWLNVKDLTIIGHSLGAHVSGLAGKQITAGIVSKIVGLDPALPLFYRSDASDRLADTDASYVEVMHTCAGVLGFAKPIGTASFYPNGGKSQPGCGHDFVGICAHLRSYDLYLESLYTKKLWAFECESFEDLQKGNCTVVNGVVRMGGEPGIQREKGIFYLQTNDKPIYGKGINDLAQQFSTTVLDF